MRNNLLVALAVSAAAIAPAAAQVSPYPAFPTVQPQSPADQLAAVMRRLATAPADVYALIQAGELSIKLDDMSAAAAFFARADKIDARNGRVKAGMASILVRAERPGEALRYFQMAEGFGLDPARFAADRGLAYDLLGEQERAQRDYRLALRTGPADDETVRRYALSLGISGRRAMALDQLEPLIRRQDRAAWRVRAFVLAMGGDIPGANNIAGAVMPTGMATGLRPFFERLPTLPAADRAFAVHFGEVRPTPERLADARMKPFLPALGPDPYAPRVQVAAAPAVQPVAAATRVRGRDRRGDRREGVQLASNRVRASAPGRVPIPSATPASGQPVRTAPASVTAQPTGIARPTIAPPVQVAAARPAPLPAASAPVQVASAVPAPPRPAQPGLPVPATAAPAPVQVASAAPPSAAPAFTAPPSVTQPALRPVAVAAASSPSAAAPGFTSGPPSVARSAVPSDIAAPAVAGPVPSVVQPAPQPVAVAAVATPPAAALGFTTAPPSAAPAPVSAAPVTAVRSEDSILARIVASISVPAEELGVTGPARPARTVVAAVQADPAARRTLAAGQAKVARETADRDAAARTIAAAAKAGARRSRGTAAEDELDAKSGRTRGKTELAGIAGRGKGAQTAEEEQDAKPTGRTRNGKVELASKGSTRGRSAKAHDEPEAASKRGTGKKDVSERSAALKKERGEPERIWVQVAGGAEDRDLSRAWTAAQKKAAALKGRTAYTTPLRATNRVVTGPFETEAEARAFVNKLAKQGVSAFQFTSGAGQKMTKLPGR